MAIPEVKPFGGLAGRRRKIHEQIGRKIEEWIRRGDFGPGDQLPPERRLADLFGVSRGSVREALRALELSGVIQSRQGGGNFVAESAHNGAMLPLSEFLERQRKQARDLSEARQMLEPRLAFLAAERATREQVEAIRGALAAQEERLKAGDIDGAFEADRLFHQLIAEAAGNQTVLGLIHYLSNLIATGRRESIHHEPRRRQSPVDHRAIVDAIARGDGPAAGAAMRQHLQNVETSLLDALQGYQRLIGTFPQRAEAAPAAHAPERPARPDFS